MYSAYKLNKQGDNIQPWRTPFPICNQSVVPCPVLTVASWPEYKFLKRQIRWSGIPFSFRIFHSLLWYSVVISSVYYIIFGLGFLSYGIFILFFIIIPIRLLIFFNIFFCVFFLYSILYIFGCLILDTFSLIWGHIFSLIWGLIFQCHIFLYFHTVHGVLVARILEWLAIPSSSGPCFVRNLHYDPSVLGGSE